MITAICKYSLRDDLTPAEAMKEMKETIHVYKGRPGLIRKYICVNMEEKYGCGIYLWEDRASAEAYFADAVPVMREQLGCEPEVTYFFTPLVLDNVTGDVQIAA